MLVNTTLIPSAGIRSDDEARWAGHRRRKPTHGYRAHLATDEGAGLVRGVEVTTADVYDAAEFEAVLPPERGDIYCDSAFTGGPAERVIIAQGDTPRTEWTLASGAAGRRPCCASKRATPRWINVVVATPGRRVVRWRVGGVRTRFFGSN